MGSSIEIFDTTGPADTVHSYRNVTECHFLTITSKSQAAEFFAEVASVELDPSNIPGIIAVGNSHGISIVL